MRTGCVVHLGEGWGLGLASLARNSGSKRDASDEEELLAQHELDHVTLARSRLEGVRYQLVQRQCTHEVLAHGHWVRVHGELAPRQFAHEVQVHARDDPMQTQRVHQKLDHEVPGDAMCDLGDWLVHMATVQRSRESLARICCDDHQIHQLDHSLG